MHIRTKYLTLANEIGRIFDPHELWRAALLKEEEQGLQKALPGHTGLTLLGLDTALSLKRERK